MSQDHSFPVTRFLALDSTNSLRIFFNSDDHFFRIKSFCPVLPVLINTWHFSTPENKILPKVAISKEIEVMEFWKPSHFTQPCKDACNVLMSHKKMSDEVAEEMLPYQCFHGTEDGIWENPDRGKSDSTGKV